MASFLFALALLSLYPPLLPSSPYPPHPAGLQAVGEGASTAMMAEMRAEREGTKDNTVSNLVDAALANEERLRKFGTRRWVVPSLGGTSVPSELLEVTAVHLTVVLQEFTIFVVTTVLLRALFYVASTVLRRATPCYTVPRRATFRPFLGRVFCASRCVLER